MNKSDRLFHVGDVEYSLLYTAATLSQGAFNSGTASVNMQYYCIVSKTYRGFTWSWTEKKCVIFLDRSSK